MIAQVKEQEAPIVEENVEEVEVISKVNKGESIQSITQEFSINANKESGMTSIVP